MARLQSSLAKVMCKYQSFINTQNPLTLPQQLAAMGSSKQLTSALKMKWMLTKQEKQNVFR